MAKKCKKCGADLKKGSKYCPKCGTSQEKKKGKLIILLFVVFIGILAFGLIYFNIIDLPFGNNNEDEIDELAGMTDEEIKESFMVEYEDVERFYEENSEVLSKINAEDSKTNLSEKEVSEMLNNLGFKDLEITTDYDINGNYYIDEQIDPNSDAVHPKYQAYYFGENEMIWVIYVINGQIMAVPVSYNMESLESNVTVSEKDSVMSYDNITNRYFETKPNKSELFVIKMDKIDAGSLNKMTKESIDIYVK